MRRWAVVRTGLCLLLGEEPLDLLDGELDKTWMGHDVLGSKRYRRDTPVWVLHQTNVLKALIEREGFGADDVPDLLFTNYKQIDRVGHYFNMDSEEVHDSLVETDEQLGNVVDFLDSEVGAGEYTVVITADHGQQPDAKAIDGYGIDPREAEQRYPGGCRDLDAHRRDRVRGTRDRIDPWLVRDDDLRGLAVDEEDGSLGEPVRHVARTLDEEQLVVAGGHVPPGADPVVVHLLERSRVDLVVLAELVARARELTLGIS